MKNNFPWINFGDVNFMEHGGCLVRQTDYSECYDVILLNPIIHNYEGSHKKPIFVVKCFVDLSDWLKDEDEQRKEFNKIIGYDENYIPKTFDEKMLYCSELVNQWGYGYWEFDPVYPPITKCNCYSFGVNENQLIVSKTVAIKFLRSYNVPYRYLRDLKSRKKE